MREPCIVRVSNNDVLCCRSSSDDSASAPCKRKRANPRLSGIGFASSDEEKSIAREHYPEKSETVAKK